MTETTATYRLIGTVELLAPLSHIGESISTTTYLNQEPVLQPDGTAEEVFVYNGNAWRGQLRDRSADYLLAALHIAHLPLDAFHLLYSGGRIGGDTVVDVAKARQYRRILPHVALLGGGVGNQILPGKLDVANMYPLVAEARPVLRAYGVDPDVLLPSYRTVTFEKSFTRTDDGKNPRHAPLLAAPAPALPAQAALFTTEPPAAAEPKKAVADQMRMTSELVAAGTRLATRLDVHGVTLPELGCLVAALHQFSTRPLLGGQGARGHGLVRLEYRYLNLTTGESGPFLSVDQRPLLGPLAQEAKDAYDTHLRTLYEAMLAQQGTEIVALLGATTAEVSA